MCVVSDYLNRSLVAVLTIKTYIVRLTSPHLQI